ncbi:Replication protein A [Vibrio chagasii]|nr:Replication protein A [Vibrio chagasii]CAH6889208.1 Replication protein A [Vibrio chagasii]CAH6889829.1 Replication protein A [Vibrio chagasii]CAH6902387.1 Replication protein A [Vibrio chagasii]CAH6936456.1 Replication protein A [Vibrio chagasii]
MTAHSEYAASSSISCLSRLLEEAPYLSRCSDNKTAMLIRPRNYAVRWSYMQVNRKEMQAWMVFDIDHDHRSVPNPYIWQDEDLPPPNLIVRNRTSNKAHLFYAIVPVCTSDQARSKPIQYFKAIYHALALRLEADLSYSGPVAKTPFHPWWQTTELHRSVYELNELADSIELETTKPWLRQDIDVSHSRNCTLFEHTRRYAYDIVDEEREKGCYTNFKRRVESFAHYKNTDTADKPPLKRSEVLAVVKSVSRWTWDKYCARSDCQRGVMRLDSGLSLQERQRRAARRTHNLRRTKTTRRIIRVCQVLLRKNQALSIGLVARNANLCRQTVSRYVYLFEWVKSALSESRRNGPERYGNYGVHQISAPITLYWAEHEVGQKKAVPESAFP